ncbi:hypothetical protein DJ84_11385 [Halorubrum ezzemoulense]|nr:hypothetical protein DJ84_11385 [Halorubrum ezzemoulense]
MCFTVFEECANGVHRDSSSTEPFLDVPGIETVDVVFVSSGEGLVGEDLVGDNCEFRWTSAVV